MVPRAQKKNLEINVNVPWLQLFRSVLCRGLPLLVQLSTLLLKRSKKGMTEVPKEETRSSPNNSWKRKVL